MKSSTWIFLGAAATFCFGFSFNEIVNPTSATSLPFATVNQSSSPQKLNQLKLGAFSVSLSVKDLNVSKQFYENLGFTVFAGGMEKNYLIMKNGNALVGLFQGMFQGNLLTFNPGWDENAKNLADFDDVREIQRQLKSKSIKLSTEVDEKTKGPGSIMTTDPDGNVILIDQHR